MWENQYYYQNIQEKVIKIFQNWKRKSWIVQPFSKGKPSYSRIDNKQVKENWTEFSILLAKNVSQLS